MSRDVHILRMLGEIEAGRGSSQRFLAREVGIALGLTNLLLRTMLRKGLVRLVRIERNRVRYLITPAGLREKSRLARAYVAHNVRFYAETRDRVRDRLASLPKPESITIRPRLVFYGAGDVAEIAYVCLRHANCDLVGIVDGQRHGRFFEFPIQRPDAVKGLTIDDQPFDYLVDTETVDRGIARALLHNCGVPSTRVVGL